MRLDRRKLLAFGLSAGTLVGVLIRLASSDEVWLVVLLGISAALVGLAQQTLP